MLNLTDENINCGEAFTTTNYAETPINILQHNTSDMISGHVIFNKVGNCTIKRNRSIEGKIRQKHFIQNICATTPGHSSPLLKSEAGLFPRHSYASSQLDKCSILGAQPIF